MNTSTWVVICILIVCSVVTICFAVASASIEIMSPLYSSAFEFAKTITAVTAGYMFAVLAKER